MTNIAIALVIREHMILIGQRPSHVALAGYWEFPGGKQEPNESLIDTVRRECLEETGVGATIVREYGRVRYRYAHGDLDLTFFLCRPFPADATPSSPYHWVPLVDLGDYQFPPANDEILARLRDEFTEIASHDERDEFE